jgi:hypothetical protein
VREEYSSICARDEKINYHITKERKRREKMGYRKHVVQ